MRKERRFYKRYLVHFPCEVLVNDHAFTSTIVNMSNNGLQIEVNEQCVEQFTKCPTSPPTCLVRMTLPNIETLELPCRLIINRRLSQLRYVLGLKFVGITDIDYMTIANFLSSL